MGKNLFFNNLPDFEKEAEEEKKRRKMPKAPSFSLDDMEDARKASYDKGHADGLQAAKDSIEQKTEILIQSLTGRITELEQAEANRATTAINNSVTMTYKALEQLLPSILTKNAATLLQESLTSFFQDQAPKSNMTLFVHSDMQSSVEKYINLLNPNITLQTDNNLPPSQSKLTWEDGHYEFKPDTMVEQILQIINKQVKDQFPNSEDSLDDSQRTEHNKTDETSQTQDAIDNE